MENTLLGTIAMTGARMGIAIGGGIGGVGVLAQLGHVDGSSSISGLDQSRALSKIIKWSEIACIRA